MSLHIYIKYYIIIFDFKISEVHCLRVSVRLTKTMMPSSVTRTDFLGPSDKLVCQAGRRVFVSLTETRKLHTSVELTIY